MAVFPKPEDTKIEPAPDTTKDIILGRAEEDKKTSGGDGGGGGGGYTPPPEEPKKEEPTEQTSQEEPTTQKEEPVQLVTDYSNKPTTEYKYEGAQDKYFKSEQEAKQSWLNWIATGSIQNARPYEGDTVYSGGIITEYGVYPLTRQGIAHPSKEFSGSIKPQAVVYYKPTTEKETVISETGVPQEVFKTSYSRYELTPNQYEVYKGLTVAKGKEPTHEEFVKAVEIQAKEEYQAEQEEQKRLNPERYEEPFTAWIISKSGQGYQMKEEGWANIKANPPEWVAGALVYEKDTGKKTEYSLTDKRNWLEKPATSVAEWGEWVIGGEIASKIPKEDVVYKPVVYYNYKVSEGKNPLKELETLFGTKVEYTTVTGAEAESLIKEKEKQKTELFKELQATGGGLAPIDVTKMAALGTIITDEAKAKEATKKQETKPAEMDLRNLNNIFPYSPLGGREKRYDTMQTFKGIPIINLSQAQEKALTKPYATLEQKGLMESFSGSSEEGIQAETTKAVMNNAAVFLGEKTAKAGLAYVTVGALGYAGGVAEAITGPSFMTGFQIGVGTYFTAEFVKEEAKLIGEGKPLQAAENLAYFYAAYKGGEAGYAKTAKLRKATMGYTPEDILISEWYNRVAYPKAVEEAKLSASSLKGILGEKEYRMAEEGIYREVGMPTSADVELGLSPKIEPTWKFKAPEVLLKQEATQEEMLSSFRMNRILAEKGFKEETQGSPIILSHEKRLIENKDVYIMKHPEKLTPRETMYKSKLLSKYNYDKTADYLEVTEGKEGWSVIKTTTKRQAMPEGQQLYEGLPIEPTTAELKPMYSGITKRERYLGIGKELSKKQKPKEEGAVFIGDIADLKPMEVIKQTSGEQKKIIKPSGGGWAISTPQAQTSAKKPEVPQFTVEDVGRTVSKNIAKEPTGKKIVEPFGKGKKFKGYITEKDTRDELFLEDEPIIDIRETKDILPTRLKFGIEPKGPSLINTKAIWVLPPETKINLLGATKTSPKPLMAPYTGTGTHTLIETIPQVITSPAMKTTPKPKARIETGVKELSLSIPTPTAKATSGVSSKLFAGIGGIFGGGSVTRQKPTEIIEPPKPPFKFGAGFGWGAKGMGGAPKHGGRYAEELLTTKFINPFFRSKKGKQKKGWF